MAVTLTLLAVDRTPGNPWAEAIALAVLSGNYAAGGDTLDFSQLYNQTDPTGKSLNSDQLPVEADAVSEGAIAGNSPNDYRVGLYTNPSDGTPPVALTPTTCLLQCFKGVTEEAAGAYDNVLISDRIIVRAKFLSQR